jgi:predicted nucleic acid-binding protein
MGINEFFAGKRIFIDTAPIIYFIEDHPTYKNVLKVLMDQVDSGQVILFSSTLTLIEVLVQPIRKQRFDLLEKYKQILTHSSSITIYSLDTLIAVKAAEIRAKYNFKTPDSIQLATSLNFTADIFLTNDKQLKINEIPSITLEELNVMYRQ